MKGRKALWVAMGLMLPLPVAWAQFELPIYQGAQKTLDLHLTEKDFLPWIKQGIEFFAALAAQKGVKVTPEEVRKVLGNLSEVRALGYVLPPNYARTLSEFYDERFPAKEGWRTNLWMLAPDGSSAVIVKSKGQLEEMFILFAGTKKEAAVTEAFVVHTKGAPDLGALFKLLSSLQSKPEGGK